MKGRDPNREKHLPSAGSVSEMSASTRAEPGSSQELHLQLSGWQGPKYPSLPRCAAHRKLNPKWTEASLGANTPLWEPGAPSGA